MIAVQNAKINSETSDLRVTPTMTVTVELTLALAMTLLIYSVVYTAQKRVVYCLHIANLSARSLITKYSTFYYYA
jgi:hypothetical protein